MPKASSAVVYINLGGPQGYRAWAKSLRGFNRVIRLALTRNLRAAGTVVKIEAQKNASYSIGHHDQASIPASLSVRLSGLSVYVQTPRTAIRGLEEYAPGEWDHPVFGQGGVTQKARPYLAPAVASKTMEAYELAGEAVQEVLDAIAAESI